MTVEEKADELAIAGLRNKIATVSKLTYSASFGRKLGLDIAAALQAELQLCRDTDDKTDEYSWMHRTCSTIGFEVPYALNRCCSETDFREPCAQHHCCSGISCGELCAP